METGAARAGAAARCSRPGELTKALAPVARELNLKIGYDHKEKAIRISPVQPTWKDDKKNTKALNQLLRRNMVKRVLVSGIAPYHKQVRNVGCVNYEITADGYDAIHWS